MIILNNVKYCIIILPIVIICFFSTSIERIYAIANICSVFWSPGLSGFSVVVFLFRKEISGLFSRLQKVTIQDNISIILKDPNVSQTLKEDVIKQLILNKRKSGLVRLSELRVSLHKLKSMIKNPNTLTISMLKKASDIVIEDLMQLRDILLLMETTNDAISKIIKLIETIIFILQEKRDLNYAINIAEMFEHFDSCWREKEVYKFDKYQEIEKVFIT